MGWYESLLWGFIYVSERTVQKGSGTVGVWNGTKVKLFKVQEMAPEGPSLLAPRGGVDAVGQTLVERVGNLTIGRRGTVDSVQGGQQQQGQQQGQQQQQQQGRRDSRRSESPDSRTRTAVV